MKVYTLTMASGSMDDSLGCECVDMILDAPRVFISRHAAEIAAADQVKDEIDSVNEDVVEADQTMMPEVSFRPTNEERTIHSFYCEETDTCYRITEVELEQ